MGMGRHTKPPGSSSRLDADSEEDAGGVESLKLEDVEPVEVVEGAVQLHQQQRETWTRRLEFVLASVGYAVGLGNVWRFPYLCYRSGGGAFLIPYIIMLFVCGIPLLFMEYAIGQYTRLGPVHGLAKICPLFKGVGLATVVISFVLATYYNVLMTWALYYLFNSFGSNLPWQSCNNTWNAVSNCSTGFPGNATHLQSASQQFFDRKLLEMTRGIEDAGGVRWELLGLLALAWLIIYFCIFKGVKSTGKVVYFTATFPYFMLFALLINNVQLPGAKTGILYFLMPNWSKLGEVQVWVNAAAQIFNSIGIAFGSMISMASYNKYNNNILRDTFVVSLANSATSILAGFVIFSAIGYMAHIHNLPVEDIATDGMAHTIHSVTISVFCETTGPLKTLKNNDDTHMTVIFLLFCFGLLRSVSTCSLLGLQGILISSIIQYTPARYGKSYTYPLWAEVLGWFISLISIIWIPLGAAHELFRNKGSLLQRLKVALTPTVDLEPIHALPEKQGVNSESVTFFSSSQ
uniref:Transporter n=1 Tax=Astyanax mexicanus TaxID=7994 RepID=A0A8B9H0K4_ASTMX